MENIFKRQLIKHTEIFKKAKVLILGCGGLGTNLCFLLAKSGVGHIKIVDYDTVEYSNLNRQIYRPTDIGKRKVDAFEEICNEFVPFCDISFENIKVTEDNVDCLTDGYDVVLEALDDEYAKSLVLEHFIATDKKLISVSGIGGVDMLDIKIKKMNNIVVCGDFKTKTDIGLYYPNVMMAASTQAIIALNWLLEEKNGR